MYKCRPLGRQGGIVYLHVQNVRANAWQPCMEPLFPHVKFPVVGNISWAGRCFEPTFAAPMCSALLKALLLCPHTDHSAAACLKYGETRQLPLSIQRWKIIRCVYSVKVHSAVLKQSGHTFLCWLFPLSAIWFYQQSWKPCSQWGVLLLQYFQFGHMTTSTTGENTL